MIYNNNVSERKISILYQSEIETNLEVITESFFDDSIANIVYLGNIGKLQSVITIIKAAEIINDNKVKFHIMGYGSELDNCKKYCKENNISNVIFYGKVDFRYGQAALKQATVGIISMTKGSEIDYPFPGKIQTYMYCGTPIIYSANGEGADFIVKHNCGAHTQPEDSEELANCIKKIIKNTSLLDAIRKCVLKTYNSYFTINHFIERLQNDLKSLIE